MAKKCAALSHHQATNGPATALARLALAAVDAVHLAITAPLAIRPYETLNRTAATIDRRLQNSLHRGSQAVIAWT
jgi:hypothetical protein